MKVTIVIEDIAPAGQAGHVVLNVHTDPVLTSAAAHAPAPSMVVAAAMLSGINRQITWEAHVPH